MNTNPLLKKKEKEREKEKRKRKTEKSLMTVITAYCSAPVKGELSQDGEMTQCLKYLLLVVWMKMAP